MLLLNAHYVLRLLDLHLYAYEIKTCKNIFLIVPCTPIWSLLFENCHVLCLESWTLLSCLCPLSMFVLLRSFLVMASLHTPSFMNVPAYLKGSNSNPAIPSGDVKAQILQYLNLWSKVMIFNPASKCLLDKKTWCIFQGKTNKNEKKHSRIPHLQT